MKGVTGGNIITEYDYDADQNVIAQRTYVENSWERGKGFAADSLADKKLISFEALKQGMQDKAGHRNLSLGTMYGNAKVIVNNTYAYDAMGNMTEKKTLSGLTQYTYDSLVQLTRVNSPKGSEEYAYDKAGNRLSKIWKDVTNKQEKRENYVYDARNRMLQRDVFAGTLGNTVQTEQHVYAYDEQGNMTAESRHSFEDGTRQLKETKTFGYDAMNRLQEVKSDKKLLQRNTYDAEGLRTEMEENDRLIKFLYDGDKVIAESDVSKGLQRFIRGYGYVSQ